MGEEIFVENVSEETKVSEKETENHKIRGKPVYHTTKQVAGMLDENESTIRYWCDEFKEFLEIKRSGRNRMFTDKNISEIQFIKRLLRESNFTVRQVKEYLKAIEEAELKPANNEKGQMLLKALTDAITQDLQQSFQAIENNIVEKVLASLQTKYLPLPEQEIQINELNKKIDMLEKNIAERDEKMLKLIEDFRGKQKTKKDGVVARILRKFKMKD